MNKNKIILKMTEYFNKIYKFTIQEMDLNLKYILDIEEKSLIDGFSLRNWMQAYNYLNSLISKLNEISLNSNSCSEDVILFGRQIASLRSGLKKVLNKDFYVDLIVDTETGIIECVK